ncbi:hypothetical protein IWQ61_010011 [Dispira simplex]|nr:hypothetical protein IWQ61_010011 [Dispira simplex]
MASDSDSSEEILSIDSNTDPLLITLMWHVEGLLSEHSTNHLLSRSTVKKITDKLPRELETWLKISNLGLPGLDHKKFSPTAQLAEVQQSKWQRQCRTLGAGFLAIAAALLKIQSKLSEGACNSDISTELVFIQKHVESLVKLCAHYIAEGNVKRRRVLLQDTGLPRPAWNIIELMAEMEDDNGTEW